MPQPVRSASARVAVTIRHHGANAPKTHEARRDLRAAQLEAHIARVVATAPPLTTEQRDALSALLRPSPAAGAA